MESYKKPLNFGPYRIFAKVAEGGMAEVFLAMSAKKEFQNQFIAIKKLHPHLNANKPFVNLLIHEAKIGVLLSHPGIAEVYDLGSYKSEFFLAMEYVHGKSLDRVFEKIRNHTAPLPSKEVATYVLFELLRAIAFAHSLQDVKGRELNIIHRDISPGNILLEYKGNVKLTDFGIATAESRLQVELSHVALGKLVYIPPEQAVNDPVVKASDLYSLSVVYYEMLTGRLPFESESSSGLYRDIIEGEYDDLRAHRPDISKELSDLIHRNLDKSSKKRFQSAPEMFEAFRQYFLKHESLDFNSRAIRAYFKKKLAEYLRKCFEDEVIEELEIIQTALTMAPDDLELQETRPQEIPSANVFEEISQVEDATQFEPDHTNEATRHYPLTEDERKKILQGLPPREAIEEFQNFEQVSPQAFEQATVPEFNQTTGQRKDKSLKIKEKLERVSIGRDEREGLRKLEPTLEINNALDLEAFEQNTFSGRQENTILLQNEFQMTSDQDGFEDAKTRVSLEDSVPSEGPRTETPSDSKVETEPDIQRTSQMTEKFKKNLSRWVKWTLAPGVGLLVFVGISFGLYQARGPLFRQIEEWNHQRLVWLNQIQAKQLLPTQQISIVITGEVPLQRQREFFAKIGQEQGPHSYRQIEALFNQAYSRFSGGTTRVVSLMVDQPVATESSLSFVSDLNSKIRSGQIFEVLEAWGLQPRTISDGTVFIYLHGPWDVRPNPFPDEYLGTRTKPVGIVFANIAETDDLTILVKLAREIARLYGAKDRIDQQTMLPEITRGLGDPRKSPLFPQEKAELMGRWVLLDNISKREIKVWDELTIGDETAREFGWPKSPPTPEAK